MIAPPHYFKGGAAELPMMEEGDAREHDEAAALHDKVLRLLQRRPELQGCELLLAQLAGSYAFNLNVEVP